MSPQYTRRRALRVADAALTSSTALAGCLNTSESVEKHFVEDEPDYEGWSDDVENYERTVDKAGQDEVSVRIGTGESNTHNVVHRPERAEEELAFESDLADEPGHTFELSTPQDTIETPLPHTAFT